ncbi:hypothetical protein [Verrucomicrobium spinosum]|uniref:hypothetical protein n=1 Tax=Verrucomicrobium spinosum TaxID=2736 RepID=UPI000946661F|nr:hypothetical protein [Verrucomicrobium spinosum]
MGERDCGPGSPHQTGGSRSGILKIYSNEKAAGHGIHIHHDAGFTDGGTTLRFRLPGLNKGESCIVGHVDRELKSVHAGHLCYAYLNPTNIMLRDSKTGIHDLKVQARRAEFLKRKEKLPPDLDAFLQTKQKVVSWKADNEWHELTLVFEGDEMRLSVDGKVLVTHRSELRPSHETVAELWSNQHPVDR